VLELRALWPGVNEMTYDDLRGEFLTDPDEHPDLFEGLPKDFYLEPWSSLWIDVHNEIHTLRKISRFVSPKTAAYFYGQIHAEVQLGIMPPEIEQRLEKLLLPFLVLNEAYKKDLQIDKEAVDAIPDVKIPFSKLEI
jgi:hypothetical protein